MKMMNSLTAVALVATLVNNLTIVEAADLTLADGKKLTGITVERVEPDGLVISTDAGIEKVKFTALPPGDRGKYGFSEHKATEFEAKQKAAQARLVEEAKRRAEAKDAEAAVSNLQHEENLAEQRIQGEGFRAVVAVFQVVEKGALGNVSIPPRNAASRLDPVQWYGATEFGLCLVDGLPDVVDGDVKRVPLYPAGRYQYVTTKGSQATVRAFATTPKRAMELLAGAQPIKK